MDYARKKTAAPRMRGPKSMQTIDTGAFHGDSEVFVAPSHIAHLARILASTALGYLREAAANRASVRHGYEGAERSGFGSGQTAGLDTGSPPEAGAPSDPHTTSVFTTADTSEHPVDTEASRIAQAIKLRKQRAALAASGASLDDGAEGKEANGNSALTTANKPTSALSSALSAMKSSNPIRTAPSTAHIGPMKGGWGAYKAVSAPSGPTAAFDPCIARRPLVTHVPRAPTLNVFTKPGEFGFYKAGGLMQSQRQAALSSLQVAKAVNDGDSSDCESVASSVWGDDRLTDYLYDDTVIGLKNGIASDCKRKPSLSMMLVTAFSRMANPTRLPDTQQPPSSERKRPRADESANAGAVEDEVGGTQRAFAEDGGANAVAQPTSEVATEVRVDGATLSPAMRPTAEALEGHTLLPPLSENLASTVPVDQDIKHDPLPLLVEALGGLVDLILRHCGAGRPTFPALEDHEGWSKISERVLKVTIDKIAESESSGTIDTDPLCRIQAWAESFAQALLQEVKSMDSVGEQKEKAVNKAGFSALRSDPSLTDEIMATRPSARLSKLLQSALPEPSRKWGIFAGGASKEATMCLNDYLRSFLHLAIHYQNLPAVVFFLSLGCDAAAEGHFWARLDDYMHGENTKSCLDLASHMMANTAGSVHVASPKQIATLIFQAVSQRVRPTEHVGRKRRHATR